MSFLRRLKDPPKTLPNGSPRIKRDWSTWLPPILIFLANLFLVFPLVKKLSPIGYWENLVVITYVLGPVFLYFYVWEVTNRRLTSLLAALIYTIPSFRLSLVIIFNDAAHVVVLGFMPLVLIFFLRYLRNQTFNPTIISAIGISLVALISPFGLFSLLIFLSIHTYSEMLLGQGRVKLFSTLLILIVVAGLSAFWYHPAFIIEILSADRGRSLLSLVLSIVPMSFFLVPVTGALSFLIFDRKPHLQAVFLAGSSFLVFLLLVFLGNYISDDLVPVPSRFLPELSLSLAFLLALILSTLVEISRSEAVAHVFKFTPKVSSGLRIGFIVFLLSFLLTSVFLLRSYYWQLSQSSPNELGAKIIATEGGLSQILGYSISLGTSFILGLIKLKSRIPKLNS